MDPTCVMLPRLWERPCGRDQPLNKTGQAPLDSLWTQCGSLLPDTGPSSTVHLPQFVFQARQRNPQPGLPGPRAELVSALAISMWTGKFDMRLRHKLQQRPSRILVVFDYSERSMS
jgi:hypothetical protein